MVGCGIGLDIVKIDWFVKQINNPKNNILDGVEVKMDVTDLVQSKWLTAQNVKESPTKTVVILGQGLKEEVVSTKGEKYNALVLPVQLDQVSKEWRVNRASLKKLVDKLGVRTESWVGKSVVLTTMLMQGGKEGIIPI